MRAVLNQLLRRQPGGLPKWPFLLCTCILITSSIYVLAVHRPLDPVTVGLCFFIALSGVGLLMLPYYLDNKAWQQAEERRRRIAAAAPKTEIDEIQHRLRSLAAEREKIQVEQRKAGEHLSKVLGPEDLVDKKEFETAPKPTPAPIPAAAVKPAPAPVPEVTAAEPEQETSVATLPPPPAPAKPARGSLLGKAFATAQSPAHTQAVNRLIQTGFKKEEEKK